MPPQELVVGADVPKKKGRVALRGDVVKDDSVACKVFTGAGFVSVIHDGRKTFLPDLLGALDKQAT